MTRKRFTEVQIIRILREQEADAKTGDLARKHGVSEAMLHHWKAKFAGTVNKALALHPQRDVLWLNSDKMVFGNWVDRLATHAGEGVATVTPFSNNASL